MRKQIYFKDAEAHMLEDLSLMLKKSQSDIVRLSIRSMYETVISRRKKANPLKNLKGICDNAVPAGFSENLDKYLYGHE